MSPNNPLESSGLLGDVKAKLGSAQIRALVDTYYSSTTEEKKKAARNELIAGLALLVDNEYEYFTSRMLSTRAFTNTALDTTAAGLALSATVVTSAGTAQLLSAIGAGVLGLRLSIDKEFFYEQSSPILVAQMNLDRAAAYATLKSGLDAPTTSYPLAVAAKDLSTYYQVGTLANAFAEMSKRVGANSTESLVAIPRLTVKVSDPGPPKEIEVTFTNKELAGRNVNVHLVGYSTTDGAPQNVVFRKTLVLLVGTDGAASARTRLATPGAAAGAAPVVLRVDLTAPTSTSLIYEPQ